MNVYSKIPLYLLSAGLTFAAAAPALAACVSNDCSALGYTKSESACSGDIIRCPFDTSKVFCKEKEVYVMAAGDLLYSDKTTSKNMIEGKTVIGVVVDPSRRIASYKFETNRQWASSNYSKVQMDVPNLPNLTDEQAKNDFNGKSNTSALVIASTSLYPAANYCYNLTTVGTSKGDWYLPAAGELLLMLNKFNQMNIGFAKAAGTQLTKGYSRAEYNSSTETHNSDCGGGGDVSSRGYTCASYVINYSGDDNKASINSSNRYWAVWSEGPRVRCFIKF